MNRDKVEMFARRLAVLLQHDRFDSAHICIEQAREEYERDVDPWNTPLDELGLGTKIANQLRAIGRVKPREVRGMDPDAMMRAIGAYGCMQVATIIDRLENLTPCNESEVEA